LSQGQQKDDAPASIVDAQGEDLQIQIAPDVRIEGPVRVRGKRNRLVLGAGVRLGSYIPAGLSVSEYDPGGSVHAGLVLEGEDNTVEISAGARLGVNLVIQGSGNRVVIGRDCHLRGLMNLLGSQSHLTIGAGTTMVQGSLQLHEPGEILIGADCMISSQVYVSLSDIHPIYDRTSGRRINPAASVIIGDHVWLGLRSLVLKGANIGAGAVVAAGAMVTGHVPSHAIVAGAPGKVMRENIEWRRDFSQDAPQPSGEIMSIGRKRVWPLFRRRRLP